MTTDLSEYLADHYGECARESCRCLLPKNPWLGRACSNWRPCGARDWDELREIGARKYADCVTLNVTR
jgi:hypothetical protein